MGQGVFVMLVGILNAAATADGGGGGEGCLVQFIRYEYPKVFSLLIKKRHQNSKQVVGGRCANFINKSRSTPHHFCKRKARFLLPTNIINNYTHCERLSLNFVLTKVCECERVWLTVSGHGGKLLAILFRRVGPLEQGTIF